MDGMWDILWEEGYDADSCVRNEAELEILLCAAEVTADHQQVLEVCTIYGISGIAGFIMSATVQFGCLYRRLAQRGNIVSSISWLW
jgi:hypothetical protein